MSICLLDTSILCELLEIPNLCKDSERVLSELDRKVRSREILLLPLSVVVETGNHIGQNGDGRQRREAAKKFVELVRSALQGKAPFTPTPFFEEQELLGWLDEFPDWAVRGSGLADLTIRKEFERQCLLNPARRVYMWSTDRHLSVYERPVRTRSRPEFRISSINPNFLSEKSADCQKKRPFRVYKRFFVLKSLRLSGKVYVRPEKSLFGWKS